MPQDIESIIDRKKPAETTVPICLDANLTAEYERLEAQLRDAGPATSLGDENSAEAVAEQMERLREQMAQSRVFFTFRALSEPRWRGFKASVPVKQDNQTDEEAADEYHGWLCKVVSASLIDPPATAEQVDRLCERLSDGEWSTLAGAAFSVNNSRQDIPFSVAASAMLRSSGRKSKRRAPSTNPERSSLADNSPASPSTSTTTPED